jgi:hypothetical protein
MSWTYWIVFVTFDARGKPAKRLSMLQIFKDLPEPIDLEPIWRTGPLERSEAFAAWKHGQSGTDGCDLTNRQVFLTDLSGSLSDLSPTQTKYGRRRNSVDAL